MQKELSMYVFSCTTTYGPLGPKFRATLLARAQDKIDVFGIFCKPRLCYTSHSKRTIHRSWAAETTNGPLGHGPFGPVVGFGAHVQEKVYVIGVFVNPDVHVDPSL